MYLMIKLLQRMNKQSLFLSVNYLARVVVMNDIYPGIFEKVDV